MEVKGIRIWSILMCTGEAGLAGVGGLPFLEGALFRVVCMFR